MEGAAYFPEKSEQCKRLAASIATRDDPARDALVALAAEFEAKAAAIGARTLTEAKIGETHPAGRNGDGRAEADD